MRVRLRTQRGFALLLVLWTMVLLALLGSTITSAGRAETRIAHNLTAAAAAQAAADGAIAVAGFHMLDNSDAHWSPGPTPQHVAIGPCMVTLALEDLRTRVDPNDAPSGLMAALMRQLGVPDTQASAIGRAITDWRVANDTGLAANYRSSGAQFGPPHEPFRSIDELGLVLGMTPAILNALRPHLSLFVAQTPSAGRADPQVAAAIADAVKRNELAVNDGEDPGPLVVLVTATATGNGARYTRTALLRMSGIGQQPYEILEWK